jgi:hypothetical protein
MHTLCPTNHPSNLLARGEIHYLPDAVSLYLAGLAIEAENGDPDGFWAKERTRAERARAIYNVGRAGDADDEAIAYDLRRAGLHEWAIALERSDYSTLAF